MNRDSEEYQAGFKDGFCRALDYVIDNARFHQTTYDSIYRTITDKKQKG